MAPSSCIELTPDEATQLLGLARRSIEHGKLTGQPLEPDPSALSGLLAQQLGSFVTLTKNGVLRGCVGTLHSTHPLARGVATAAFNAAYRDSRFAPLSDTEIDQVRIEISVLSPLEPIDVGSNKELLANLRPHADGLLLEDSNHRATFLPKVWEKIAAPQEFVRQIKYKAGLPDNYWSESIRFFRYHTTSITESEGEPVAPT